MLAQTDYQDIYYEHAWTNWQVSSLTFSTCPKSVIPTCFKQTTIVPVPKNNKVTCLNDYRPVAITSVAMKFLKGWSWLTNTIIPKTIDPLQFAYCTNRSTDDYSPAFNTSKLITKLRTLGLNTSLCNWILDFLTGHPQVVKGR